MNKNEFVSALRTYIEDPPNWGKPGFAADVLEYFDSLELTGSETDRNWTESTLPQILLSMIYDERRQRNAGYPGYQPSDLFDAPDSYEMIHRVGEKSNVKSLLEEVIGSTTLFEIVDKLLSADRHAITAKFVQFAQQTYDRGGLRSHLFDTIGHREGSIMDTYGTTLFIALMRDDEVELTFRRKNPEGHNEGVLAFAVNKNDRHGITGRLRHQYTDVQTAFSMIDDVIMGWSVLEASASSQSS